MNIKKESKKSFRIAVCILAGTLSLTGNISAFAAENPGIVQTADAAAMEGRISADSVQADGETPYLQLSSDETISLYKNQVYKKLRVTGMADGDYVKSWESSNQKIFTVTGNQKGTSRIKAGTKGGTAKLTITLASGLKKTVKVQVADIKGLPSSVKVQKGAKYQLSPKLVGMPSNTGISYQSSNKKVVTVNKKGMLRGIGTGTASVTVKAGKAKRKIKVTVWQKASGSMTTMKDSDYTRLIRGGLTKDELRFLLAWGPNGMKNTMSTVSDQWFMLNQLCMGAHNENAWYGKSYIREDYVNREGYGYSVSDLNRYLAVWRKTQYSSTNIPAKNAKIINGMLCYNAATLSWSSKAVITSASYNSDKIEVNYTVTISGDERPTTTSRKQAVFTKDSSGKFSIEKVINL